MKFKNFLQEIKALGASEIVTSLSVIQRNLAEMTPEELDEFGEWLENELDPDDYDIEIDGPLDNFNSIISVINDLDSEDLDYINYMMGDANDDDSNVTDSDNNGNDVSVAALQTNMEPGDVAAAQGKVTEVVSRKFKTKNFNKRKTKRFQLSKAEFRAKRAQRKRDNRKNRMEHKAYYRKNKIKLKKYNQSYRKAIKTGKTFAKIRR